jgi:hypothetical protein
MMNHLEKNKPFRNRQVAGSIPALGSNQIAAGSLSPPHIPPVFLCSCPKRTLRTSLGSVCGEKTESPRFGPSGIFA